MFINRRAMDERVDEVEELVARELYETVREGGCHRRAARRDEKLIYCIRDSCTINDVKNKIYDARVNRLAAR